MSRTLFVLWATLKRAIPDVRANGDRAERLPNTLSIRFPHVRGSEVLAATPEVAASTGSACHETHASPSAVLLAMGLATDEALETVRLSVGSTTTDEDVEMAAHALVRGWRRASGRARDVLAGIVVGCETEGCVQIERLVRDGVRLARWGFHARNLDSIRGRWHIRVFPSSFACRQRLG